MQKNKIRLIVIIIVSTIFHSKVLLADDFTLGKVIIKEQSGLSRSLAYVELQLQLDLTDKNYDELYVVAEDLNNGEQVACQVFGKKVFESENVILFHIIFPISIDAKQQKSFLLKRVNEKKIIETDLNFSGEGLNIGVENNFYSANLSKSDQSEAKSHDAGQLNELLIKMDFNQLLLRTENRMHWGPNFQKVGMEYYETIAGWDNPEVYEMNNGPYLIFTQRKDTAPDNNEILLTANYSFYAGLPYFKFFSSMNITKDVTLFLLRNDEMTMDSLFTNVAYKNNSGQIIDLHFSDRYEELEKNPIENNAPWLCFYNEDKGYAFGSIRIKYDNTNTSGLPSPTYLPHTKISDGADGGKYWNRRLIHEHPVFVPRGSNYIEENAYIVFRINKENKFKEIKDCMTALRNPLEIYVIPKIFIKENN